MSPPVPEEGVPALDPDRFSATNRKRLSGPGLRTLKRIADLWELDEHQRLAVLGSPSRSSYRRWLKAAGSQRDLTLNADVLTRISAVLGIHAALGSLYGSPGEQLAWLRGSNSAAMFGSRPPLELVTCGRLDGLLAVRRFLDAVLASNPPETDEVDQGFRLL